MTEPTAAWRCSALAHAQLGGRERFVGAALVESHPAILRRLVPASSSLLT
jgi:hypothetical protein